MHPFAPICFLEMMVGKKLSEERVEVLLFSEADATNEPSEAEATRTNKHFVHDGCSGENILMYGL